MPVQWIKFGATALAVVMLYGAGYYRAAALAKAEQQAERAVYERSLRTAAEQYAQQLKQAQAEKQKWFDFAQAQSERLHQSNLALHQAQTRLQEQIHETVAQDSNDYRGIGSNSLQLYNRAFGYPDSAD